MKRVIYIWVAAVFLAGVTASAREVTIDEARLVAENFVEMVQAKKGSWGGHESAHIASMEPLRRGDRPLGYAFHVEPAGYVVISLYHELAPVRAYSTRSRLDLEDGKLGDVVKVFQEMVHDGLEERHGGIIAPADDLRQLVPVHFDEAWDRLLDHEFNVSSIPREARSRSLGIDYQEGDSLLTTTWNQPPPYNNFCPHMGCEWPGFGYYNWNAHAGCVAIAAAQVAKYWNWPPEGEGTGYDQTWDWANMGARYTYSGSDSLFLVEHQDGSVAYATQEELDAVAMICAWMGDAVDMDYGCDGSSAYTRDLVGVFPGHFRYSDGTNDLDRDDVTYSQWVSTLQQQFDANRPVVYDIPGHAIVADGWDEDLGVYYFHFVYGHNGSNDGWFSCGEIPGGGSTDEHFLVLNIYPDCILGGVPLGSYTAPAYPYRYMECDIFSLDADFYEGHNFQVLGSGLLIETWDTTEDFGIRFHGAPGAETTFFMNGDPEDNTRIRIKDGTIRMTLGAQMVLC